MADAPPEDNDPQWTATAPVDGYVEVYGAGKLKSAFDLDEDETVEVYMGVRGDE